MSELLPCPFCGAEVEVLSDMHRTWGLVKHRDGCLFPNFRNHQISEYDFEAWNKRHVGTCKDEGGIGANGEQVFSCSECGCVLSLYDGDGTNTLCTGFIYDYPRYCPSCGRKVDG